VALAVMKWQIDRIVGSTVGVPDVAQLLALHSLPVHCATSNLAVNANSDVDCNWRMDGGEDLAIVALLQKCPQLQSQLEHGHVLPTQRLAGATVVAARIADRETAKLSPQLEYLAGC
jgi:hypothetical protein